MRTLDEALTSLTLRADWVRLVGGNCVPPPKNSWLEDNMLLLSAIAGGLAALCCGAPLCVLGVKFCLKQRQRKQLKQQLPLKRTSTFEAAPEPEPEPEPEQAHPRDN